MRSVVETGGARVRSAEVGDDGLFHVGAPLPIHSYLRSLWQRRDFLLLVPLGRLRAQTHSTVLGGLWHLLNPLLSAGVYYVVFGIIFEGRQSIPNYAGFLVVGLFSFLYTQRTLTTGAGSVTNNRSLIAQVNFPRAALPISATLAELVSHSWAVVALALIVVPTGESPSATWLLLVPVLLVQSMFNLGLAMVVARLAFHFRDIQHFLPYVLRMWMYLSGIFFTVDFVENRLGSDHVLVTLFEWNPAYVYASLTRQAMLDAHPIDPSMWAVGALWGVVVLVLGFVYFRAREIEYASE